MSAEKCPLCNVPIKAENLRGHYARVHPKRLGSLNEPQTFVDTQKSTGTSRRKVVLAVLVVVILVGVTVFVLRPGGQSQQGPPPAAPLTLEASQSAVSISGTGLLSFNITLTPKEPLSSAVVLSVPNRPPGVTNVIFQPNTLTLSQNSGLSRATLVVGQAFAPGTFPVRVVATVGSGIAETTVALQISSPSPSKHFYLIANHTGWNYTDSGEKNPRIEVQKGETFTLTAISIPNDIHHYLGIYPSGTPPSQVSEGSTGYYVRSDFDWSHYPGNVTMTFTSWIAGTLEYYCDTHSDTMHGVINVTG